MGPSRPVRLKRRYRVLKYSNQTHIAHSIAHNQIGKLITILLYTVQTYIHVNHIARFVYMQVLSVCFYANATILSGSMEYNFINKNDVKSQIITSFRYYILILDYQI